MTSAATTCDALKDAHAPCCGASTITPSVNCPDGCFEIDGGFGLRFIDSNDRQTGRYDVLETFRVSTTPSHIIIELPGTDEYKNWLNPTVSHVPDYNAMVTSGIPRKHQLGMVDGSIIVARVQPDLVPNDETFVPRLTATIDNIRTRHPDTNLYMSGYSSGAALAIRYLNATRASPVAFKGVWLQSPVFLPHSMLAYFPSYFVDINLPTFDGGVYSAVFNTYTNTRFVVNTHVSDPYIGAALGYDNDATISKLLSLKRVGDVFLIHNHTSSEPTFNPHTYSMRLFESGTPPPSMDGRSDYYIDPLDALIM